MFDVKHVELDSNPHNQMSFSKTGKFLYIHHQVKINYLVTTPRSQSQPKQIILAHNPNFILDNQANFSKFV